jgi:hypothetical protein
VAGRREVRKLCKPHDFGKFRDGAPAEKFDVADDGQTTSGSSGTMRQTRTILAGRREPPPDAPIPLYWQPLCLVLASTSAASLSTRSAVKSRRAKGKAGQSV